MKGDKLTFQVKFWAFLGPMICIFTLFIFLIKGSSSPVFLPLIMLLGVPLCWRWHIWGVVVSVGLVVGTLISYYGELPLDERFWFLGMGFSTSMALFITALSFEEVESLVDSIQLESRSRLENLWKVDEKQKYTAEELKKKRDQVENLERINRSYQKLIDLSTQEHIETKAGDEPSAEAKYRQLREQFEEKSNVLNVTRRELFHAKEQILKLQKEHEEMKLYQLSEVECALERHLVQMEKEHAELEANHALEIEALQSMVSDILQEKQSP